MPYGQTARPCRVYQYGVPPGHGPGAAAARARVAMRQRVALWNQLVAREQDYRAAREALLEQAAPELATADEAARAARRRALLRDPALQPQLQALDRACQQDARALARASGLWWVNYEDVLLAWQQARKRPGTLRFHSARRAPGKLLVRWQRGLPVAALLGGADTRARLAPVPAEAFTAPARGTRRQLQRTQLQVRIGSDGRAPLWLTLPLVLHRPLPPDGLVRAIHVIREPLAGHERWRVSIVVEAPAPAPAPRAGTVAVHLGWRRVPGGLRVAVWRDAAGREGEWVLPQAVLDRLTKPEALRAQRDAHLNTLRAALGAWRATRPQVPDWFRAATATWCQWRSPARYVALERQWRAQRWPGDEAGYALLDAWYRHDRHLWEWECHQRDQARAHRREWYRRWAAALVRAYGTIVLGRFDLRPLARRAPLGADATPGERARDAAARHYRVLAAPHSLWGALDNAARREGVAVVQAATAYMTVRCAACGHQNRWDTAASIVQQCAACGQVWDQDWHAARNLLDWLASQTPPPAAPAAGLRAEPAAG